ncbi:MAG TPA: tripartite tricarboxylate transporter substrate binding protein [Burkholderiales bacterium]|nr:tripartite tricarboxylate transporter substrate binding protein [Burkholderiales bacterium]
MKTAVRAFFAMTALAAAACGAQDYPSRPIRFVIGFLPGGPSDTIARVLAGKLGEGLGQSVIVDNRAGAGGNLSAEIVARAQPDGHTLLLGTGGPLVIAPITGQKVAFDPDRDFAPVTKLGESMGILTAHPSMPVNGVQDLVALARAKPGEIDYASSGVGTIHHLAAELLSSMAGIRMNHVPYKGSGAALPAMLGGQVKIGFGPIVPAIPHVKAGRLRALGVTGTKRSLAAPEIPTIAEQGLKGFGATSWYGVFVPARTPKSVIARLNREFAAALAAPEVRERLTRDGVEPQASTPELLAALVMGERKLWDKVIKQAGIRIE